MAEAVDRKTIPMDDPCWGTSELHRHDLFHLLRRIDEGAFGSIVEDVSHGGHRRPPPLILHEDARYLALNKPPDLRMDGPHPATVHKLLTYWYPPPSLLARVAARDGDGDGDPGRSLVDEVSSLAKHNDLPDNSLRPCHQLDYATSGVLLVARDRRAAGAAGRSFQDRTARKAYLAVVRGHVDPDSYPALPPGSLDGWSNGSVERGYRSTRVNKGKGTYVGFVPPHGMFHMWKGMMGKRRRRGGGTAGGEAPAVAVGETAESFPRQNKRLKDEERKAFLVPDPQLSTDEEERLMGMKWAQARAEAKFVEVFRKMSEQYNAAHRNIANEESSAAVSNQPAQGLGNSSRGRGGRSSEPLPPLFRIKGEDPNSFYVCAALAEVPGEFRCEVQPSDAHKSWKCSVSAINTTGDGSLDFKPSLTRCVVLWKGRMASQEEGLSEIEVTKLRLEPRTGRRHQLRLHLAAVAGHAITGDVAYGGHSALVGTRCDRMCLHAHSLRIPLPSGVDDNTDKEFLAPDPFDVVVGPDGRDTLQVLGH
uniref:Pseudouridine synthase RsuA/RluA-like domain-containing protein n=1 Tax=Trieres chinensis TaxID=1514140 RepID=A0A7S1YWM8_TRICV|mmetsp:Transcript_12439/g.25829  ORF Transcript_12439/g.25829 Transcript_12439/m.25829 type:complete len:534 (+) Transcript_12439:29-1630(+)